MLRLDRLTIIGFGPFVGPTAIDFPDGDGVTVVYGENGRGKTSLLNAIRFAFFGEALGRGSRRRGLRSLANRERAADGVFDFEVMLKFRHDTNHYELVRRCEALVDDPRLESDFSVETQLRRNDEVLGPAERQRSLEIVFPREISRFFLFDGELLQEYEELLINESAAGQKISEAIERILGVPLLKRARTHLGALADEAAAASARAAQREQRTQALGGSLSQALDLKAGHLEEIEALEREREALATERSSIDEYLQTVARHRAQMERQQRAASDLVRSESDQREAETNLRRAMAGAWRTALRERVRIARDDAQSTLEQAIGGITQVTLARSLAAGQCEVCSQSISDDLRGHLESHNDLTADAATAMTALGVALSAVRALSTFDDSDNRNEVEALWRRIQEERIAQHRLRYEIAEIDDQLEGSDQEEIRRARARQTDLIERLVVVRQGLDQERESLNEVNQSIARLTRQLEETGSSDVVHSQHRATLLRSAGEVMAAAIERYKDQLRLGVEASATELFLSMISETQDYAGLRINGSYGLEIVHVDGRAEEARSAGQEHVVALALMAALQRNAPLRGPIVMDSPFGRLDEVHTSNVTQALPAMASQVLLLVYEAEVGPAQVRRLLGDKLLAEYRLEYVSSRHTKIAAIR